MTFLKRFIWIVGIMPMLVVPLAGAQAPALNRIEAPYPNLQTSGTISVAGGHYGSGAVAYGSVGTPLILRGSNFGSSGMVWFTSYKNGVVDTNQSPASATVTMWTSTVLMLTVPSAARTGLVTVSTSAGTSSGLPFLVSTNPSYGSSCPALPGDNPLQIVTSTLQDGTVGQAYSVALEAAGGTSPYIWSVTVGSLPTGLSLSPQGVLSGTPTSATGSPVNLTIQATDQNELVADALLTLNIDGSAKTTGAVYSYSAVYDGVGNVTSYNDSVMGAWTLQYDTLNRLAGASVSDGDYDGQSACWNYDAFGNRLQQEMSNSPFQTGSGGANACQPQATAQVSTDIATFSVNNQITGTNALGVSAQPTYDASGNILTDGINSYLYDAEGRVCAVTDTIMPGMSTMTGYLYDAGGNRVAKGTITTWGSCDPAVNGFQTSSASTSYYELDTSGRQATTINGAGTWVRSDVYGAGGLLATYDNKGLHFHLADPLGTRRVQASSTGFAETDCESLPFGDQLNCFPDPNAPTSADDATPLHFTGKERDSESGNDYFGARYYGSSMGRFLSADPSGLLYADPMNPQSFNQYNYGLNNPLVNIDPNGLDCIHVNVDTGVLEGFESGDCDNSTEEKANSGQYVDGTVTSITTSDGTTDPADASGIVRGYSGTNEDTGALISGTFAAPMDSPLQPVPQIDPDEQRIDSLVQGVATDTASMPWLCNASVSVRGQIPKTPFAVGLSADKNGVQQSARAKLGENADGLQVNLTTNGKKVGYQFSAPIVGTPFRGTLSTGNNQATVGVSRNIPFGGTLSVSGSLTFGYLGDAHCRN